VVSRGSVQKKLEFQPKGTASSMRLIMLVSWLHTTGKDWMRRLCPEGVNPTLSASKQMLWKKKQQIFRSHSRS